MADDHTASGSEGREEPAVAGDERPEHGLHNRPKLAGKILRGFCPQSLSTGITLNSL